MKITNSIKAPHIDWSEVQQKAYIVTRDGNNIPIDIPLKCPFCNNKMDMVSELGEANDKVDIYREGCSHIIGKEHQNNVRGYCNNCSTELHIVICNYSLSYVD